MMIRSSGSLSSFDDEYRNFDKIFGFNLDQLEEEFEFTKSCQSKEYKGAISSIEFFMQLISVKLDSYRDSTLESISKFSNDFATSGGLKNYLRFRKPSELQQQRGSFNSHKSSYFNEICLRLIHLFIIYISIKYTIVAFVQFEHDFVLFNIQSRIKRVNTTQKCANREDIVFAPYSDEAAQKMIERLKFATNLLEFLYNPIISVYGAAITIFSTLGLVLIVMFCAGIIFVCKERCRVDVLSFMYDHNNERLRIRNDLEYIICTLSDSIENYYSTNRIRNRLDTRPTNYDYLYQSANKNRSEVGTQHLRLRKSFHRSSNTDGNNNNTIDINQIIPPTSNIPVLKIDIDCITSAAISKKESKFLSAKILFSYDLPDMVRPAHLTSNWHKKLICLEGYYYYLRMISGLVPCFIVITATILTEIYLRVEERLNIFECSQKQGNSFYIRKKINLSPLNFEDLTKYLAYDGSRLNFIKLMLTVEVKYYLTRRIVFGLLELYLATTIILFIASFYYLLYVRSFLNRMIWLNQLQEQLNWCSKHIIDIGRTKDLDGFNGFTNLLNGNEKSFIVNSDQLIMKILTKHFEVEADVDNGVEAKKERVKENKLISLKAILITYLNFELFRKQQANYHRLANFLIFQMTLLIGSVLLLCYFIGTNVNVGSNSILLFTSTYLVLCMNVHLISSAVMTNKILKLMRTIFKLMAGASSIDLQLTDIIDIWRRQLLDDEQTVEHFSIRFFGVYLSYDRIITFNAYLVALWLVLLKQMREKQ